MIPLSVPNLSGNEWKYIKECLDTNWVSMVGSYVNKFEQMVADFTGARCAVATANGTMALHVSLQLAGVQQGHLVILPNVTFVASANAIKYTGASPLLIDIDKKDWQMDTSLLEKFLEKNTKTVNGECRHSSSGRIIKAIMPVHVLGNMGDMEKLKEIAGRYKLLIIEDASESLGSYFDNRHSGTFGLMGALSFNGNKIITTGGGGMIVTNDEKLGKRAKHLTTQAKAKPDEYYHDEVGYNYRLVNILAAMGVAQLELLPSFLSRKKEIQERYVKALSGVKGIGFQSVSSRVQPNHWLFTIRTGEKTQLLNLLKEQNIEARPLWVPMNKLPMFEKETYVTEDNVSEKIYNTCVSLPCSTGIKNEEIDRVIECVNSIAHE